MTKSEISTKVADISEVNLEYDTQLDALTLSMIEMDEYKFDRIINTNIQQLGFERTVLEVLHPFLDKLSILWLTGSINPVQENFISYLIRQKIIAAIDREPFAVGKSVRKFLIYLPEGEGQELSLLLLHYILKARRHQVIYLGMNISLTDLRDAYKIHKPDFIFTMISETFDRQPVKFYVDELSDTFKESQVLLSGYQVVAQDVKSSSNVTVLQSLEDTINYIDDLKTGAVSDS
ncbi:MAG: B12-binding domain-containing protein [Bacteroidota bacterium]